MKMSTLFITTTLFFSSNIILSNKLPDILHAARNGDAQSVRAHLEKGNNCAIKDTYGNNALHLAAEHGHADIIRLLTEYYENCGFLGRLWSYVSGPTLPNIDEKNSESNTPLHCASEQGKIDAAVMLLKKGANKNLVNKQNLSAAFIALYKDNEELLKQLIENGFDPRTHTNNNHPMLAWAILHNKQRSLAFLANNPILINAPDANGIRPIHMAAQTNDPEKFKLLVSKKADVTATDNAGNTVIHHSAMTGTDAIMNFLLDNYATMTGKNSHNKDAFIDKNKDGENPLSLASKYKKNTMFYLLANRLNTNLKGQNDNNDTFLHMAAFHNNGELAINLLVDDKVPVVKNNQQKIFYHYFIEHGNRPVLQAIKALHIPLIECDADDNTPLQIALKNKQKQCLPELLDPRTINHKNKHGETALCLAAARNYADEIETLIQRGANKFLSDPLHDAIQHDALDALKTLQQHGIVLTGRVNDHGDTRAHFAAKYDSTNILRYFESQHIPLNIMNNDGNNPFFVAAAHGNLDATKLLLDLDEDNYNTRNVERALAYIQNNQSRKHKDVYTFLTKEHNKRVTICEEIDNIYKNANNVATQKEGLLNKNGFSWVDSLRYSVRKPTYHSTLDLYKITSAQRAEIKDTYREWHNKELTQKSEIEQKIAEMKRNTINLINAQQAQQTQAALSRLAAQRANDERIRQEQQAARERDERIRKQKEDERARQEQADRNRLKQERDKQQAAERERNRLAQNDRARQERHDKALMAQHVPAASAPLLDENELVNSNLQPSAPPMEENKCHLCSAELKAKPLPCPKCGKKIADTCPACVKKQNGKCATCNTPAEAIVECCICNEPGSTIKIPCANGNKHSAEICKGCLARIKDCPICRSELKKNQ